MTITLNALQKQRRDTASNWTNNNPTLLDGEFGWETDTKKLKIGDGSTAWQSLDYLPIPDTNRLLAGNLTVGGNFQVNGTTTTVNTSVLDVEDINITLGKVSTPSDTTADGGGITLKASSDRTITWSNANDSWDFNQNINAASTYAYRINNVSVLNATTLGSSVVNSSLTSLGTIATGVWQGTAIGSAYMTAGTTSVAGALQLTNSASSTSTTTAATPNAVKTAKDAADAAQTTANAALPKAGGQITGNITCSSTQTFDGRDLSVDGAKLDGIEASADVTDATNVNAAGAIMESDVDAKGDILAGTADNTVARLPVGTNGYVLKADSSAAAGLAWAADSSGIANVVDDSSPQLGGDLDTNSHNISLDDDHKVNFGDSNDLQIYFDGNEGYLLNQTSFLKIGCDQEIRLGKASLDRNYLRAFGDGAVELYYDNSKKFETTANGAKISGTTAAFLEITTTSGSHNPMFRGSNGDRTFDTGLRGDSGDAWCVYDVTAADLRFAITTNGDVNIPNDSKKLQLGASQDLQIYHSTNSWITNATGDLNIDNNASGGDVKIYTESDFDVYTADSVQAIKCNKDGATELHWGGGQTGTGKKLETTSSGVSFNGDTFMPDNEYAHFGDNNDTYMGHNGSDTVIVNNTGWLFLQGASVGIKSAGGANRVLCSGDKVDLFYGSSAKLETTNTGVSVTGDLVASGNVTAYSDARLKTDIHTINNALGTVGKLRGVNYKWLKDGKQSTGLIAQEVEEVLPELVHTNQLDGEDVKSVDYGKLVGVLIEAIKELKAEVDELKGGK